MIGPQIDHIWVEQICQQRWNGTMMDEGDTGKTGQREVQLIEETRAKWTSER